MAYDDQEALRLLAKAVDELSPDLSGRQEAGDELLKALCTTAPKAGLAVERESGGIWVMLPRVAKVKVVHTQHGKFSIYPEKGRGSKDVVKDVEFFFNSVSKQLEGNEEDKWLGSALGTPRRMRSALAVLVEKVVDVLRNSTNVRT